MFRLVSGDIRTGRLRMRAFLGSKALHELNEYLAVVILMIGFHNAHFTASG